MKKQNQTKLAFNKANVAELNVQQLKNVNGGVITGQDTDTNPNSGCICDPILPKLTIIKNQF
ncbi:class I lanthipeptide [Flavobacterium poyangense]|uniref:class I lanthipeptide n=1 Tax=Flavobacterium poyangense TaxID=2204302 RepID=UPI001420E02B|nr:class I lanthipeptide [Flavobacterium sp. JXAS1]